MSSSDSIPENDDRSALEKYWFPIVSCRGFKAALVLIIVSAALALAWREIHSLNWHDVRDATSTIQPGYLIIAALLTLAAIATMGLYDALAFPSGKVGISFVRRWLTGMFTFSWSNLLSMGGTTGPAIRVFLYRCQGLDATEIAQGLGIHYFAAGFGMGGWIFASLMPLPEAINPCLFSRLNPSSHC